LKLIAILECFTQVWVFYSANAQVASGLLKILSLVLYIIGIG